MDTKDQEPFIVSIKADGSYWIDVQGNNKTETLAVIKDRVSKVLRQKPATPILVWGDSAVDYGAVVNLMSELQLAGAPSVGLVTEPPSN
jgi:biopolymer transport protein TolR